MMIFLPPAIRGRLIFLITTADHRYLRQADGSCQGHIPDIISSSCDLTGKFIIYDAQPKIKQLHISYFHGIIFMLNRLKEYKNTSN